MNRAKKKLSIFDLAELHNREYVTPEDVHDSLRSGCDVATVMADLMAAIAGIEGSGVEDDECAAFVIVKRHPKYAKLLRSRERREPGRPKVKK